MMTHFTDLSPYTYLPETIPAGISAVNIGWLSRLHDFPQGDPPVGFVDALAELCTEQNRARTRGWHTCTLCTHEKRSDGHILLAKAEGNYRLGNAEIRVISENGRWLVSPNLVYHYVTEHRYIPPGEFIEGVIARRTAPEYYREYPSAMH